MRKEGLGSAALRVGAACRFQRTVVVGVDVAHLSTSVGPSRKWGKRPFQAMIHAAGQWQGGKCGDERAGRSVRGRGVR
eukprot:7495-Chlamydomonas_euryale.AAC.1